MMPHALHQRLRSLPIKTKLVLIILGSCLAALLLEGLGFVIYERLRIREEMGHEMQSLASIIGNRSTAALIFNDSAAAEENLAALQENPNIRGACIFDSAGEVVARFQRRGDGQENCPREAAFSSEPRFVDDQLLITQPIRIDDVALGSVHIRANLSRLTALWQNFLILSATIALVSIAVMFLIANRLQRLISRPLESLNETAQAVTNGNDYSLRATVESEDEIGKLVGSFNTMLQTIERQTDALQDANRHLAESEDRLQAANADLEGRVAERTARLQEVASEAERARASADAASLAKGQFLANMSHEIRTPMNAIIGMTHLALQTPLDAKQRNYLEKVHRSAENLLGIINDILDFSKIEAGKLSMEEVPFELDDVMDDLAGLSAGRAEAKGLELLFDLPAGLDKSLRGDPLRLAQVLTNLVSNAIKFTEHGEIIVRIQTLRRDDTQVELQFSVADTGIGLSDDVKSRLFTAFSQADASITRRYGGTGLGLSISQHLVKLMGGRIWVDSEPGRGATFHFTACFGLQAEPLPRHVLDAATLKGLRALLVDDNPAALEVLSAMAATFGLAITELDNGADALAAIARAREEGQPYDLLLIDWKMPGMDGISCIEALHRQLPDDSLPAIVMVTAFSREDAISKALDHGLKQPEVLTKPITASTLLETIGSALGRSTPTPSRRTLNRQSSDLAQQQLANACILLVEDNDLNQELLTDLLLRARVKVLLADNGQAALDMLDKEPAIELVLMDCQMPIMDGYTATRHIRDNPAWRHLPVIALTANAMHGDRERALAAGMNDHLAKPIQVDAFYLTIARWLHPDTVIDGEHDVATAAPPNVTDLPPLPGIDTHLGLSIASGNQRLYRRLLGTFLDTQADFIETYNEARTANDGILATRLAHTLKSNAANIGASALREQAEHLEFASRDGDAAAIEQALDGTTSSLAEVLDGLRQQGFSAKGPGAASALRPLPPAQEVEPLLHNLADLLDHAELAALAQADELAEQLRDTRLEQDSRALSKALRRYDFDEAIPIFAALTAELTKRPGTT